MASAAILAVTQSRWLLLVYVIQLLTFLEVTAACCCPEGLIAYWQLNASLTVNDGEEDSPSTVEQAHPT